MAMNALQYVKNVGKSFGYAAIDTVSELNPQIASLASNAKDLGEDLYDSIQDFKGKAIGMSADEKGFLGKGKDLVKEARDNLIDDLKTGNWYNKEREDRVSGEVIGEAFGLDDMFDFDFDDDWDLDDDGDIGTDDSTKALVNAQKSSATAIVDGMDAIGSRSSKAIANATVKSADYVVTANNRNNRAMYNLNQKGFEKMTTGMAAINANISTLVALGEPLTKHMQNSATFYTQTAEYQKQVLQKLDILIKNTTMEETTKTKRPENRFSDLFGYDGSLDLMQYYNMIKTRVKNSDGGMGGMLDMVGGPEGFIRMLVSNPGKEVLSSATKAVIPKSLKKQMESFNKTLGAFGPAFMDMLSDFNPGGFLGDVFDQIKGFILPSKDNKKTVDVGRYNHGRAMWTGESEKALQEVIPTYLAAITSALTGAPMTQYNYKTGKFVTRSEIKALNDKRFQDQANYAGSDYRYDVINALRNQGLSDADYKKYEQMADSFFAQALEKGGKATREFVNGKSSAEKWNMDEEFYEFLQAILEGYKPSKANGNKNQQYKGMEFAGNTRIYRDKYSDILRDIENGNDVSRSQYDDSSIIMNGNKDYRKNPGGLLGTDKDGFDIWYYLKELYQSNWYLADNIGNFGYNGFGSGSGSSGGNIPNGPMGGGVPNLAFKNVREIGQNTKSNAKDDSDAAKDNARDQQKGKKLNPGEAKLYVANARTVSADEKRIDQLENKQKTDKLSSDEEAKLERLLNKRANEEKTRGFIDKTKERFKNNKVASSFVNLYETTSKFLAQPAEVISTILAKGEESLWNLVFGKDDEESGLFHWFIEKGNDLYNKITKNLLGGFKDKLTGWFNKFTSNEEGNSFADDVRVAGRQAKNWVKWKASDIWYGTKNKNRRSAPGEGETEPVDNGNASYGRKVTKTGVVTVSEGELIIPSEYNPYYHGSTDHRSQARNEDRATSQFFGRYDEGGPIEGEPSSDDLDIPEKGTKEYQKWYRDIYLANRVYKTGPDGAKYLDRDATLSKIKSSKNRAKRDQNIRHAQNQTFSESGISGILSGSMSKLVNAIQDTVNELIPKDRKKEGSALDKILGEKNSEELKKANVPEEMIKNRGAMGVGALTGAGVSLLTGAIVGPLAGAAIGAGVGLVVKSDSIQKALFGDIETDKDGNVIGRKGNLLSKEMSDYITQKLPKVGGAAAAGGVAGLFMGSPLLGTILGAGIGFASQSDKVKEALFGKTDENGNYRRGLISKETQDRLKKAVPSMGAGAIAGLLIGPFGPVGNIVLGSAIGYASTSESFKDAILGKVGEDGKREGGMVGAFRGYLFGSDENGKHKQGVFESITGIFQKVGREVSIRMSDTFKNLNKYLRGKGADAIRKSGIVDRAKNTRVGRAVSKVGKVVTAPARGLRSGLEAADKSLTKRALNKGHNVYNNKEGRMSTAEERNNLRGTFGENFKGDTSMTNWDNLIAQAQSEEELQELYDLAAYYDDPTKYYDEQLSKSKDELANELTNQGISSDVANMINKGAAKGQNLEELLKKNGIDLSDEQLNAVSSRYTTAINARGDKKLAQTDAKEARKLLLEKDGRFSKMKGVDLDDAGRAKDLIKNDMDVRFHKSPEKKEEEKQDKYYETVIEKIPNLLERLDAHLLGKDTDGNPLSETTNPDEKPLDTEESKESENAGGKLADALNNASGPKPPALGSDEEDTTGNGESDTKTVMTDNGPMQYVRNAQGEWVIDNRDSETKAAQEKQNKMMDAICSIPLLGGAIKGLGGLFGGLKDGLLGSDDGKKEGLLSKLLGGSGFLGGIFNMFSSFFGGSIVSTVGKGLLGAVKALAPAAAVTALLVGAFSGLFDDLVDKLTDGAFSKDNETTNITDKDTGETYTLATDDDGNYITNEDGQYLTTAGNYVDGNMTKYGTDTSFSSQFKKNILTGLATGGGSVASTLVKVGTKLTTKAAENNTLVATLVKSLTSGFNKILQVVQKCPIIPSTIKTAIANNADDVAATAAEEVAKEAGEKAATSAVIGSIDDALYVLKVVTLTVTAVNAWGNAESILGITDDATVGQKLIAVLVAVTNAAIPIIGNLIPNSTLVNIFMKIAPKIGIDVSSLEEQREAALADLEQYNEENGTSYTTVEQLNQARGKAGIVTKAVNGVKSLATNVKENGIVGTVTNAATTTVTNIKNSVGDVVSGAKDTVSDIVSGFTTLKNYALDGEIVKLWQYTGKESDDEEDSVGAIASITNNITKLLLTPTTLFKAVTNTISNAFSGMMDSFSKEQSAYSKAVEAIDEHAENGEPLKVLNTNYESTTDGLAGGIFTAVFNITKIFSAFKALFNTVGNTVSNLGSNVVSTIKNFFGKGSDDEEESGAGSRIRRYKGGDSAASDDLFVSQNSAQYKNLPYSNSTIGEIGCGPATATMLMNSIVPGSMTMDEAISEAGDYENDNGTSADYFGSVLGKRGLSAEYVESKDGSKASSIRSMLESGKPTVLLGEDANNTDKSRSPFGPNSHYVLATGIDSNGNIIVDDPEATHGGTVYNSSILKNVSLGISSNSGTTMDGDVSTDSSGGDSSYTDNETTQAVWAYFTNKGYSPETTAAIMGNMWQESKIDPTRIQGTSGPAAGIVQWENYRTKEGRWLNMSNYAASQGKDWTDLNSQLDFTESELESKDINNRMSGTTAPSNLTKLGATPMSYSDWKASTDLENATKLFEGAFERAGTPNMDARIAAAKGYYNLYSGKEYTYDGSVGSVNAGDGVVSDTSGNTVGSTTSGTTSSDTSSSSSDSLSISGILSTITSAFASAFGKLLSGSSDDSSSSSTGTSSTGSTASSSSSNAAAVSSALTGLGDLTGTDEQQQLVKYMDSIKGTLDYSMSGARDPEKGSADCSSTVNWAYKKVFGESVGDSTLAMINADNTSVVDMDSSANYSTGTESSSGPNVDNLAPGDILLYSRPSYSYSSGRPYRVGHVEMYYGDNQRIGHPGSDKGPKITDITKDAKHYIEARRFNDVIAKQQAEASTESTNDYKSKLDAMDDHDLSAAGSGLKLPQVKRINTTTKFKNISGGASDITGSTSTSSSSNASSTAIVTILKSLLTAVQSIVTNTADIPTVSKTVTNYCETSASTSVSTGSTTSTKSGSTSSGSTAVDPSNDTALQDLMSTLGSIATG